MTENILWNAVVLVQRLWFIEKGERFSPNDVLTDEKNILESNHYLGFTGYGIDDFKKKEKRRLPIFNWFENTFKGKDSNVFFPNVDKLSCLMSERYNQLKGKFPSLTIERRQVLFQPKTKQDCLILSTNIYVGTKMHKFQLPVMDMPVCVLISGFITFQMI